MIVDDRGLERRFASGNRVAEILRTLAVDVGAVFAGEDVDVEGNQHE